jgi:cell division transport system ATP-binding protein
MIAFDSVSKLYRAPDFVLKDVRFEIGAREFVVLTGPSGTGKTTLLQLITRETHPTRGRVIVAGRNLATLGWRQLPLVRRQIGVIFQDFRLLPRRTIGENVGFVLRAMAWPAAARHDRVRRVLDWVGLAHRARDYPETLSGGEQQRVAIARALAPEPRLILADEPTGNLDPDRSKEILAILREVNARGATVIVASHDPQMVDQPSARVMRLQAGRVEG